MLFSAQQGQLASLDNTLSLQGSVINLPRAGFPQVVLVCASVQNAYWFFDQRDMELIRVDAQLRPLAKTGRMDQLLGLSPEPVQMQELANWLYVNSPNTGSWCSTFSAPTTRPSAFSAPSASRCARKVSSTCATAGSNGTTCSASPRSPLPMPPLSELDALRDARVEQGHLYLLLQDRIVIAHVGKR
ncbi:MAG: hypothetical protein IPG10_16040 [Flavobacteriales bacterium]|nr:hypothetical protein [Flavobacteriales bacterium]